MTGALWAVFSGVGFGVFQTFNRRAVQGMDVLMATFLQLLVSAVVLSLATVLTLDATVVGRLTGTAVLNFSLAGLLHFFVGWTFLNASQKHIGAARTSSLIGTIPIFGAFFAALTLAELPTLYGVIGILLIVGGVYLVNDARIQRVPVAATVGAPRLEGRATGLRSLGFGLAAAICWSLSPTFIRYGLAEVDFPLLGVTVGIVASALSYAVLLLVRRSQGAVGPLEMEALAYKVFAAVLVALATWMRWISLDLAPVAVALALSLVSVPVVNFLSPLVSGRDLERVTAQVWLGSILIIGGSLMLILLS
ncbi:MAG: DMT family transporter [Chloroflexi bacterium]|nr:DMT family transporter [Chloroflexota bacterium]MCI0644892.1 DMT family transporter [Chloroflexota bacterium]MCI0729709.1 DMT family transporter [Chloroflexota bacterium]